MRFIGATHEHSRLGKRKAWGLSRSIVIVLLVKALGTYPHCNSTDNCFCWLGRLRRIASAGCAVQFLGTCSCCQLQHRVDWPYYLHDDASCARGFSLESWSLVAVHVHTPPVVPGPLVCGSMLLALFVRSWPMLPTPPCVRACVRVSVCVRVHACVQYAHVSLQMCSC